MGQFSIPVERFEVGNGLVLGGGCLGVYLGAQLGEVYFLGVVHLLLVLAQNHRPDIVISLTVP